MRFVPRAVAGHNAPVTAPHVFPDVVITTDRLVLRPFRSSDAAAAYAAANDPVTQKWLPLPRPYTREVAADWVDRLSHQIRESGDGVVRAIEADGELAGCIDLKHTDWESRVTEIGYWSSPGWRGKGVMTEAAAGLARWALAEAGFERIEIRVAPGNAASLRVAEKAGFVREGVARNAGYTHDGRTDLVIFSLIPADLQRSA